MMQKDTLPNIPSELLRAGLEDMRLLEASSRKHLYKPFHTLWHKPETITEDDGNGGIVTRKNCLICLAGGVLAQRFGFDPDEEVFFVGSGRLPETAVGKFYALDCLRQGNVGSDSDGGAMYYFSRGDCGAEAKIAVDGWEDKLRSSDYFIDELYGDGNCEVYVANFGDFNGWEEWNVVSKSLTRLADELEAVGL